MISFHMRAAVPCLWSVALLTLGGCASNQPSISLDELFPPADLLVAPGTADLENIHLPAVMVNASVLNEKGSMTRKACSGSILHQKLVVSAAHCVCASRTPIQNDGATHPSGSRAHASTGSAPPKKRGMTRESALKDVSLTSIVDTKSRCAKTAVVTTIQYNSAGKQRSASEPDIHEYTGDVEIHPAFELISGQRGHAQGVVWSNADLAVIFLKESLPASVPRLELAGAEVQAGDFVTMVGYASGDDVSPTYGIRHFGTNRVSSIIHLETGSSVFRSEARVLPDGATASHMQGGDSGGACVRTSDKNVLVGVSTVGSKTSNGGHMSIFTSVYSHRGWLLQMLERADKS